MKEINLNEITNWVEQNIGQFHENRLSKINTIKLSKVLKSKNPYLFRAKDSDNPSDIISGILSAYISSSEEGVFGNFLERLAIFINDSVYAGRKAIVEGIDLDFDKGGERYLVAIKSGPNWGNDSQIKKLIDQFNTARKRISTSGNITTLVCVNGCCYGQSNPRYEYQSKGQYYKMCGKRFWELISGDSNLYLKLLKPLSHNAAYHNSMFDKSYKLVLNNLTNEFLSEFCNSDSSINWEKIVEFNSLTNSEKR